MGGEEMAGRATAAGKDKSSFAVTCSLLSKYLKEKKGGLQGLDLGMPPPPAAVGAGGAFRLPPTTMNLLSALDAPAEKPNAADSVLFSLEKAGTEPQPPLKAPTDDQNDENARAAAVEQARQLTIFYDGKVIVFYNFPSTKVKDLLKIVRVSDGVDKATGIAAAQSMAPRPAHNSISDLPIARRNSLHRFLEKRKGRIAENAPYQDNSSVASSKKANGDKSWLGFGQEVTIKQEII
ncbi:hypothetical protein ABZP36_033644 [Zizania latifolia]